MIDNGDAIVGTQSIEAIDDPRAPAVAAGIPRPPVLRALTSIRFFAALHVALYHLVRPFGRWGLAAGAMSLGYQGVSFFFVLSGFILTYAHAQEYEEGRGSKARFWVARFARVYPLYFLLTLVAALRDPHDLLVKHHWLALPADLLMVQSWLIRTVNLFNVAAWTLSCEAFFYFVFPFVLMRLRPRSRGRGLMWVAGFFVLSMAVPMWLMAHYPDAAWHEEPVNSAGQRLVFLARRLPILALPEFLAGMSLGWLFLRFGPSRRTAAAMAWGGGVLLLVLIALGGRLPFVAVHNGLLMPVYALILIGLSREHWLSSALSRPWMLVLGEASFGLYLFHVVLLDYTRRLTPELTIGSAMWRLAIAIPVTVLLHLYLERPCRRLILTWWAKRHPARRTAEIPHAA